LVRAGVAFSPPRSATLRYRNMARQRYCWRLARYRNTCASLQTWSSSQLPRPARKAGFSTFENDCGRETDCLLEGGGFELPVPRSPTPRRCLRLVSHSAAQPHARRDVCRPKPVSVALHPAGDPEPENVSRGTDGSNPLSSSGESPANLSFRRIEVQGRSREADGDSRGGEIKAAPPFSSSLPALRRMRRKAT
jgi:hypothetical protein